MAAKHMAAMVLMWGIISSYDRNAPSLRYLGHCRKTAAAAD
jgi:hypothetical protein